VKAVTTYICSDGVPHIFDAANRDIPLCGADVFIMSQDIGQWAPPACEQCAFEVLHIVEWPR
jgi:hypothetical protein